MSEYAESLRTAVEGGYFLRTVSAREAANRRHTNSIGHHLKDFMTVIYMT